MLSDVLHATQRPWEGRKSGQLCGQVVEFMSVYGTSEMRYQMKPQVSLVQRQIYILFVQNENFLVLKLLILVFSLRNYSFDIKCIANKQRLASPGLLDTSRYKLLREKGSD